jgi:hypothetical protein
VIPNCKKPGKFLAILKIQQSEPTDDYAFEITAEYEVFAMFYKIRSGIGMLENLSLI